MTTINLTPIVERRYSDVDQPGRELVVLIGQPEPDPEAGGDWRCALQVVGLDAEPRYIHGVDGLQALQIAIGVARKTLAASGLRLSWLAGEDVGIEYTLSTYLPEGIRQGIERVVDDLVRLVERAVLEVDERRHDRR